MAKIKVNVDGRKLGLRVEDAKRLQEAFDRLEVARRAIDTLVKCGAAGCEDREAQCTQCIEQAEEIVTGKHLL